MMRRFLTFGMKVKEEKNCHEVARNLLLDIGLLMEIYTIKVVTKEMLVDIILLDSVKGKLVKLLSLMEKINM